MAVKRGALLRAMFGLCTLGWADAAGAAAPAMEARYRCVLPDGEVRESTQDLSHVFRGAVTRCETYYAAPGHDAMWAKQPRVVSLSLTRKAPDTAFRLVALAAPMLATSFKPAPQLTRAFSTMSPQYVSLVKDASSRYGLDPQLVTALIHVESGFKPHARSPKGALGLMQIMPATGARYGVTNPRSLLDPMVNIDVGTRYLRDLHEMFPGRVDLVLAAYNAGEGAVIKRGHSIPPFPETQMYVRRVMQLVGLSK